MRSAQWKPMSRPKPLPLVEEEPLDGPDQDPEDDGSCGRQRTHRHGQSHGSHGLGTLHPRSETGEKGGHRSRVRLGSGALPDDPVVIPMVAGSTPERPVHPIEEDSIDGAGGPGGHPQIVAHLPELFPDLLRHGLVDQHLGRERRCARRTIPSSGCC